MLDQKSNQKNQGCAKILRFCLVVAAETEKTRPYSFYSALRPIAQHRAVRVQVGLKHFSVFTASTTAKSGTVTELVEVLQGRSAFHVWRYLIYIYIARLLFPNTNSSIIRKLLIINPINHKFFSEPLLN